MVERLAALAPVRAGTLLGIGDDAAVIAGSPAMVLTQDLLVDGVHFRLAATTARDLGHKALAVNLSDLAAMGADPVAALVGIGAPPGLLGERLDDLYAGIDALAAEHEASIAGGDVTSATEVVLAVAAVGALPEGRRAPRRSGARAGDALAVTGALGAAAAGLRILDDPSLADSVHDAQALLDAYHRPNPRVAEGRLLADAGVNAMMDLSDGLALDAERMSRASGAGIEIDLDALPLASGVADLAGAAGVDPHVLAASGGDDYELLVAAPSATLAEVERQGVRLTSVGRVVRGTPGVRVVRGGRPVELATGGWEHDV